MRNDICPKCMVALTPKDEGDTVLLVCGACGFRKELKGWMEHECPKCGSNKAMVIFDGMVRGDEGMTTMFRCIKCGAVDKDGYKGY